MRITDHGREVYENVKDMIDIRIEVFKDYEEHQRKALIRLGTYAMLLRSGYDLESASDQIKADKETCKDILHEQKILFSPCQTIKRNEVETALGINLAQGNEKGHTFSEIKGDNIESHTYAVRKFSLNKDMEAAYELLKDPEDEEFLELVLKLKNDGKNSRQIVDYLFDYYKTATQTNFYPLIATLFKIMGYQCSFSRPGDNGSRWDAIIEDDERSIPIEIKSPTEVAVLSIKAIRQALENKIVLLSRETFKTKPEVTSLAVGYGMPGNRTDINDLINYIKETYGYSIGMIDLRTMLSVAISILIDRKGFAKEELYSLEGLMYADI